jgi:hypothetical protein
LYSQLYLWTCIFNDLRGHFKKVEARCRYLGIQPWNHVYKWVGDDLIPFDDYIIVCNNLGKVPRLKKTIMVALTLVGCGNKYSKVPRSANL